MGDLESFDALDELAHGRQRRLAPVLRGAGQRGRQLMAERCQSLQIRDMGKRSTETGFVIAALALSDGKVACRLVALCCRTADQPCNGVQDGARPMHVPVEWRTPPDDPLDRDL